VSSQWGRYVLCFYVTQSQDGSQYPFHCHTITEAQNSITYYKHPRISTNIHSSLTALTKLQNSKQLCGGWDSIFSHLFNSLGWVRSLNIGFIFYITAVHVLLVFYGRHTRYGYRGPKTMMTNLICKRFIKTPLDCLRHLKNI
jgi:hypothetical protein